MRPVQENNRNPGTSLLSRITFRLTNKWLGFVVLIRGLPKHVLRSIKYARLRKQAFAMRPDYSAGCGLVMLDTELDDFIEDYS